MKIPKIANAVGHIDDELINSAAKNEKAAKKTLWLRWASIAACLAVILIVASVAMPTLPGRENITPTVGNDITVPDLLNGDTTTCIQNETTSVTDRETTVAYSAVEPSIPATTAAEKYTDETVQANGSNEAGFSEAYIYRVDESEFSSYKGGKVIEENKTGEKIADVSVSAGWVNNEYEWLTRETLRAEVYLIKDISKDVAVALKFIEKGDALTTTHYYVITNPDADLSPVREYVIASFTVNNTVDEKGEETTFSGFTDDGTVVEYTSEESKR